MSERKFWRYQLESDLENQTAPPLALHPNLSGLDRLKMSNLADAIDMRDARQRGEYSLRALIGKSFLTPENIGYAVGLMAI